MYTHCESQTAETDTEEEFDQTTLRHWREEGFDVTYLPYSDGGQSYVATLKSLDKELHLGDKFAIIGSSIFAQCCYEGLLTDYH